MKHPLNGSEVQSRIIVLVYFPDFKFYLYKITKAIKKVLIFQMKLRTVSIVFPFSIRLKRLLKHPLKSGEV